jgi:hypothetical protein
VSTHTEWGHAGEAGYTLCTAAQASAELGAEGTVDGPYVLGLLNAVGDGLVLEGTATQLVTYLETVAWQVRRQLHQQSRR